MPDAAPVVPTPQATVQPAPQPAPPVVAAPTPPVAPTTPAESMPQGMQQGKDGRVQVLSQSAFKRLKDEARDKGRKEALSTFAKDAGFTTVDDLQKALAGLKNPAAPAPTPEVRPPAETPGNGNGNNPKTGDKWDRERVQLQRQIDDLARRAKTETEGRKELQRQLDAKEAEMELKVAAIGHGIKDSDAASFAVMLLTKSLEGKSDEEMAKFDHDKYFVELRTSHPYLFGEVVKPATTGNGAGAPAAPKPADAAASAAQNGKVDATKMTPEEYRAHLARRGLAINI